MLEVTSAYRTIAQQLILFNHEQAGRCHIPAAAPPGQSRHQSGLSLDTPDYEDWKPCLESNGWRWLGEFDPVHFDYIGESSRDLRPVAIRAFQRLWNRNHIDDQIAADGLWGRETQDRLDRSPAAGFRKTIYGFRHLNGDVCDTKGLAIGHGVTTIAIATVPQPRYQTRVA